MSDTEEDEAEKARRRKAFGDWNRDKQASRKLREELAAAEALAAEVEEDAKLPPEITR